MEGPGEVKRLRMKWEIDPEPESEFVRQLPGVHTTEDMVSLWDRKGEIIAWHREEWVADPSVARQMVEIVKCFYECGSSEVRRRLEPPFQVKRE
jgi:hypothetical protein